jgi:hypothetical protein
MVLTFRVAFSSPNSSCFASLRSPQSSCKAEYAPCSAKKCHATVPTMTLGPRRIKINPIDNQSPKKTHALQPCAGAKTSNRGAACATNQQACSSRHITDQRRGIGLKVTIPRWCSSPVWHEPPLGCNNCRAESVQEVFRFVGPPANRFCAAKKGPMSADKTEMQTGQVHAWQSAASEAGEQGGLIPSCVSPTFHVKCNLPEDILHCLRCCSQSWDTYQWRRDGLLALGR